jgi:hypothetical protein
MQLAVTACSAHTRHINPAPLPAAAAHTQQWPTGSSNPFQQTQPLLQVLCTTRVSSPPTPPHFAAPLPYYCENKVDNSVAKMRVANRPLQWLLTRLLQSWGRSSTNLRCAMRILSAMLAYAIPKMLPCVLPADAGSCQHNFQNLREPITGHAQHTKGAFHRTKP